MMDTALDFGKIVIADLILSGDNALIIGMAAAGLAPDLRKKAILYGMVIAAVLRCGDAASQHPGAAVHRWPVALLGVLAALPRDP